MKIKSVTLGGEEERYEVTVYLFSLPTMHKITYEDFKHIANRVDILDKVTEQSFYSRTFRVDHFNGIVVFYFQAKTNEQYFIERLEEEEL